MEKLINSAKISASKVLLDEIAVSDYGSSGNLSGDMNTLTDLMEQRPVTKLGQQIQRIAQILETVEPHKLIRKPSWWERFTGSALERQVMFRMARVNLDKLLAAAKDTAAGVKDTIAQIHALEKKFIDEKKSIEAHIAIGHAVLKTNPDAGVSTGVLVGTNTRERFARRLTNLSTLLASYEVSIMQMQMAKATATDMVDRFEETASTLIPVWQQHAIALAAVKDMNAEMMAEVSKVHHALVKTLAENTKERVNS